MHGTIDKVLGTNRQMLPTDKRIEEFLRTPNIFSNKHTICFHVCSFFVCLILKCCVKNTEDGDEIFAQLTIMDVEYAKPWSSSKTKAKKEQEFPQESILFLQVVFLNTLTS